MATEPGHILRPAESGERAALLGLYAAAVRSQCTGLYSPSQVEAWAGHGQPEGAVAATIDRGFTLVNPVAPGDERLAAFAVLDPDDRLALLYCDGRWSRQGRAAALVRALEQRASQQGVHQLRTEASQLSRPLLLRLGWQIEACETVPYAGVLFERWRMIRVLTAGHG
ncbi:MAG: GNAT family N-acetyltransferase [Cyanobacteria bacterium REEB417]|nr:GNAT family N-acetyltransferase [Cyanobacteria bacterium REEB417]